MGTRSKNHANSMKIKVRSKKVLRYRAEFLKWGTLTPWTFAQVPISLNPLLKAQQCVIIDLLTRSAPRWMGSESASHTLARTRPAFGLLDSVTTLLHANKAA